MAIRAFSISNLHTNLALELLFLESIALLAIKATLRIYMPPIKAFRKLEPPSQPPTSAYLAAL